MDSRIVELSQDKPLLVVFIRHLGCIFCKEMLSKLSKSRSLIEAKGVGIVIIHMGPEEDAKRLFESYGLGVVNTILDPHRLLYKEFELEKGTLWEHFSPKVVYKAMIAFFNGSRQTKIQGNPYQLPGAFLVYKGQVKQSYVSVDAGDIPDFRELVQTSHAL